jgi:hypothetical protein
LNSWNGDEQAAEKKPQNAFEHVQALCSELFKRDLGRGLNTHLSPLGRDVFRSPTLRSTNSAVKFDLSRPVFGLSDQKFAELNCSIADVSKARELRPGI